MTEIAERLAWRVSSRSVLLGAIVKSEQTVRARGPLSARYECASYFEELSDIARFFDENDFGLTEKSARTIEAHKEKFLGPKETLQIARGTLASIGIKNKIPWHRAVELRSVKRRLLPAWTALQLLGKLDPLEPGDYVRILMRPLITNGKSDTFEVTANGPSLRSSPAAQEVHPEHEFFYLAR